MNERQARTSQFLGTRPPHLIHRYDFDELPTLVETPAFSIKKLLAIRDRFVTCPLSLDSQARPYIKLYDAIECTPILARQIAEDFYASMRAYPVELILSADRFFPFGQRVGHFFYVKTGELIPYRFEGGYVNYSIMARGRAWG